MRKYIFLFLIFLTFQKAESATFPISNTSINITGINTPAKPVFNITTAKVKDVEKLLGRKLKLKEKIALKALQWKLKKGIPNKKKDEGSNKGKTAMILGIIAIACLAIPIASIASIPLAILAIVFGNQAKRENPNDGKAKAGVILGWVTLGLIVLAVTLIVVAFAAWGWGWG